MYEVCILHLRNFASCVYDVRMNRRHKRTHEKSVRLNLTITPTLYSHFETIRQQLAIDGPSEYFQLCLRRDTGLLLPTDDGPRK